MSRNKANKKSKTTSQTRLYTLLLKWFTWQKVGVLLTGLGIIVSLIIFILSRGEPEREIDVIKGRIFDNIDKIESTFHPEEIPVELDSLEDVRMVREFMNLSLQVCSLWGAIERSDSYLYHLKNGRAQADFVWEHNMERETQCDKLQVRIEKIVCELQAYAKDHELFEYTLVNFSKLFKFREQMKIESEKYVLLSKEATVHFEKYEIEEAYKIYDDIKNNPEFNVYDDTFFDFLVDTGNVYDKAIKKYYLDK